MILLLLGWLTYRWILAKRASTETFLRVVPSSSKSESEIEIEAPTEQTSAAVLSPPIATAGLLSLGRSADSSSNDRESESDSGSESVALSSEDTASSRAIDHLIEGWELSDEGSEADVEPEAESEVESSSGSAYESESQAQSTEEVLEYP